MFLKDQVKQEKYFKSFAFLSYKHLKHFDLFFFSKIYFRPKQKLKKLDFNLVILLAFSHIVPFVHKNEANCLQLKLMFITGVLSCLPSRKA